MVFGDVREEQLDWNNIVARMILFAKVTDGAWEFAIFGDAYEIEGLFFVFLFCGAFGVEDLIDLFNFGYGPACSHFEYKRFRI